ncbi:MAG: hypothetical protein HGJ94_01720 [Desulfosarcina sp.]|nr:hypothetical protein [Desulfosarcina sp.]
MYRPVGSWKKEPNSTAGVIDGKPVIFEYGPPADIPRLMENWFELYREIDQTIQSGDTQLNLESFMCT